MTPQFLELLESRLSRLRDEHNNRLLFHDSDALQAVDIRRKATISESYENLLRSTELALSEYCEKVHSEVLQFADETVTEISIEDRDAILKTATSKFDASIYLKRFDLFGDAIGRHFGRAGAFIQLDEHRTDLYRAREHAGTSTTISRFLDSLNDDLDLLIQRKQRVPVEKGRSASDAGPHWTSHWGFLLTAVATVAGVAGTYRAFVPAPATLTGASLVEQKASGASASASGSRASSVSATQTPRIASAPK